MMDAVLQDGSLKHTARLFVAIIARTKRTVKKMLINLWVKDKSDDVYVNMQSCASTLDA